MWFLVIFYLFWLYYKCRNKVWCYDLHIEAEILTKARMSRNDKKIATIFKVLNFTTTTTTTITTGKKQQQTTTDNNWQQLTTTDNNWQQQTTTDNNRQQQTTTTTDNLTSFLSLTVIINWNQGELGHAAPQNLNDAILEPARELDACTDDSDSDVE